MRQPQLQSSTLASSHLHPWLGVPPRPPANFPPPPVSRRLCVSIAPNWMRFAGRAPRGARISGGLGGTHLRHFLESCEVLVRPPQFFAQHSILLLERQRRVRTTRRDGGCRRTGTVRPRGVARLPRLLDGPVPAVLDQRQAVGPGRRRPNLPQLLDLRGHRDRVTEERGTARAGEHPAQGLWVTTLDRSKSKKRIRPAIPL